MKNPIKNQNGIALISTLMLLVLGFAVVAILFRLSTQETKLAHLEQGYSTALDAAKGATDLFIFTVQNGFALGVPPTAPFAGMAYNQVNCLQVKLTQATSEPWSADPGWTAACPSQANATSSDPTTGYDIVLTNFNNYTVYLKVIDNTKTDAVGSTTAPCYNGCYYYTVVARAQPTTGGTNTHADVSFVYRYDQ